DSWRCGSGARPRSLRLDVEPLGGRRGEGSRRANPYRGLALLSGRYPVMSRYVDPTEQLVTEIVVRDMKRSVAFYRRLGFELLRDGGDFVELTWENHRLFLAQPSAFHEVDRVESVVSQFPRANVRVMVPNVDDYWARANEIGAQIIVSI